MQFPYFLSHLSRQGPGWEGEGAPLSSAGLLTLPCSAHPGLVLPCPPPGLGVEGDESPGGRHMQRHRSRDNMARESERHREQLKGPEIQRAKPGTPPCRDPSQGYTHRCQGPRCPLSASLGLEAPTWPCLHTSKQAALPGQALPPSRYRAVGPLVGASPSLHCLSQG